MILLKNDKFFYNKTDDFIKMIDSLGKTDDFIKSDKFAQ